jgi:heme exporter protein D
VTWNSLSDFVAMGGYALYVWGSYGMTALLVAIELAALRGRRQRAMDDLRRARASLGGTR